MDDWRTGAIKRVQNKYTSQCRSQIIAPCIQGGCCGCETLYSLMMDAIWCWCSLWNKEYAIWQDMDDWGYYDGAGGRKWQLN